MGCSSSSSLAQSVQGTQVKQVGGQSDVNEAVKMLQRGNILEPSLSNQLELHFACTNLPKADLTSKSDPFVVLFLKDKSQQWVEVGRTEIITDNHNPTFVTAIEISFLFEERQPLKVEIYDADDLTQLASLAKQDFLGSAELYVHEIVNGEKQTAERNLKNKKLARNGSVKIWGEQLLEDSRPSSNLIKFEIEGKNIKSGRKLFLKLLRSKEKDSEEFIAVYQSEIARVSSAYSYRWKLITLSAFSLIRDDPERNIQIQIFEWKSSGDHVLLKNKTYNFEQLVNETESMGWAIPNFGTIVFKNVIIEIRSSFLDYIFGGCNISLFVAVDYTMSNGAPTEPRSLHYYDLNSNQYIQAIQAVGTILESYDNDKMISALGFGGQFPGTGVSHCFSLTGNIFNPEVLRVQGLLESYQNSLNKVQLSGPTYFAEIIHYVANIANFQYTNYSNFCQNYNILLLLTDGAIMDMRKTINEIVRSTHLPLSIVIVGVGDFDFSDMDKLDADETPLKAEDGQIMSRDIVQFVPFNDFRHNPSELAKQTLAEIPKQLVDFMSMNKIKPLNPMELQHSRINNQNPTGLYYHNFKEEYRNRMAQKGINLDSLNFMMDSGIPTANEGYLMSVAQRGRNYRNPFAANAITEQQYYQQFQ